ncbi:hypothetical protein D1007_18105 [Hordeum vulgare]|nr:hypothetical protein D1007_18105 [Hordeum vulgare]
MVLYGVHGKDAAPELAPLGVTAGLDVQLKGDEIADVVERVDGGDGGGGGGGRGIGSFKTSRAGKFASLCDTCLESKVAQNMTRSRIGRPPKNLSPGTKTTTAASPTSSYGRAPTNFYPVGKTASVPSPISSGMVSKNFSPGAKTTRAGSPTSYGRVPRNFYPVAKTPSAASPTSSGRVPKNFSPGSKPTSAGRITRKDNGLHKLVFMSGILPEGADVGYYVGGKVLLLGFLLFVYAASFFSQSE